VQFVWDAQLGPIKDSLGIMSVPISSSVSGLKEFAAESSIAVTTKMVAAASHAIGNIDRRHVMVVDDKKNFVLKHRIDHVTQANRRSCLSFFVYFDGGLGGPISWRCHLSL